MFVSFHYVFQAHIRIWRSDTLQTVKVIGVGELERAVACLAFSPIEVSQRPLIYVKADGSFAENQFIFPSVIFFFVEPMFDNFRLKS